MSESTVLQVIHVRNIPFELDIEDLRAVFEENFVVISAFIARRSNGKSNGYGFVEFSCPEDAQKALKLGTIWVRERLLVVNPAFICKQYQLYFNTPAPAIRYFTVKVTNLPTDIEEGQLCQLFNEMSTSSCSIVRNPRSGASLGEGVVNFESEDDAQRAVTILNGTRLSNTHYLHGEVTTEIPIPLPNITYSRRRPRLRFRRWAGMILKGRPPPTGRKYFCKPVDPFYLPSAFEEIINRRDEVEDVQVDQELKSLMKSVTNCEPIVMNGPLTQQSYSCIFHNLINTEETRMRVDIRQYDLHGVTFEYRKGLYVIPVPGLAEKRPSVMRGDIVKVKLHGGYERVVHDGYAHFVNLDNVHVSFHRDIHPYVAREETFDVQFTFNRTSLRLMHRALEMSAEVWHKFWESQMSIRSVTMPISQFFGRVKLNPEQNNAVVTMLHNSQAPLVLHGPPGTGKTATLVEAILQIVNRSKKSRILICAPSNSAVDLVASLLLGRIGSAKMLRLNGFMRDPKQLDPQSLMAHCCWNGGSFDIPDVSTLQGYHIILCTCVSSGYLYSMGVPRGHFSNIFVDEAGEALEPETLIPFQLAKAGTSVVIAGDHLQLGPIVRSSTALEWKYDRSLMEHLLVLFPDKFVCKLLRSYRSHPALMKLYSVLFYESKLINCYDPSGSGSLPIWKELPNPTIPLMFIHSEQEEARDHDSPSWYNVREEVIIVEIAQKLLTDPALKLSADDIGIITPYRKQVQKIQYHLKSLEKPYNGCKVGTVENFQGQERKVILLSLVRSRVVNLGHDSKFNLGFCGNPKRLNVAISRAKDLLVIVGNGTLFGSNDYYWAQLLTYFKSHNLFKGPTPRWQYKPRSGEGEGEKGDAHDDQAWRDDDK